MRYLMTIKHRACPQPRERFRMMTLGNGKKVPQSYVPERHRVHVWKYCVVDAWRAAGKPTFDCPLAVRIDITSKRVTGNGWDDSRGSGDVDNFAKSTLDALNSRAFVDDCQVCVLLVTKRKCKHERDEQTVLTIEPLPDDHVQLAEYLHAFVTPTSDEVTASSKPIPF